MNTLLTEFEQIVGKTIFRLSELTSWCSERMVLEFDDNTTIVFRSRSLYEGDTTIEVMQQNELELEDQAKLGLIDPAEVTRIRERDRVSREERNKLDRRLKYEQLKQEFGE